MKKKLAKLSMSNIMELWNISGKKPASYTDQCNALYRACARVVASTLPPAKLSPKIIHREAWMLNALISAAITIDALHDVDRQLDAATKALMRSWFPVPQPSTPKRKRK